jgi:hypothetical protein
MLRDSESHFVRLRLMRDSLTSKHTNSALPERAASGNREFR